MSKRAMMAVIIALLIVIASGVGYMVNEKRLEKKQEQERIEALHNAEEGFMEHEAKRASDFTDKLDTPINPTKKKK